MYWVPVIGLHVIAEEEAEKSCYVEVVYLGNADDPDHFLFRMTNTIEEVKARIQNEKNIDKEQQKIIFKQKGSDVAGKVLHDDTTLQEVIHMADEKESVRIQLVCKLVGGGTI